MMLPAWLRRWTTTTAQYERKLADADRRVVAAFATAAQQRKARLLAERQRNDARARVDAARAAATEHGRARREQEKTLDAIGALLGDRSLSAQQVMVRIAQLLDVELAEGGGSGG